jgi:hypothetical protein
MNQQGVLDEETCKSERRDLDERPSPERHLEVSKCRGMEVGSATPLELWATLVVFIKHQLYARFYPRC